MIRIKSEKDLIRDIGFDFRNQCPYGWNPHMDDMMGKVHAADKLRIDRYIFQFRGGRYHFPLDYCEPALNCIPFFEAL